MTGKEALEKIKNIQYYKEEKNWITATSLQNTEVYKVLEKEYELLAKYKRAFEILKDSELIHFFKYEETDIYEIITGDGTQILTKEEYELLEELMKDE